MQLAASIEVSAPADEVFAVYADVERWPTWTPTVTSVERLDQGPFRIGARARVRQPRIPTAVWEVTELVPGRSFVWVARGPGIRTTGRHEVEPIGADQSRITAALAQEGWLGAVVGRVTRRLTQRYLNTEVQGLKTFCERSISG